MHVAAIVNLHKIITNILILKLRLLAADNKSIIICLIYNKAENKDKTEECLTKYFELGNDGQ